MGHGIIFVARKERMDSEEKKASQNYLGKCGENYNLPFLSLFCPHLFSEKVILSVACGRRMEFRQVFSLVLPKRNAPLYCFKFRVFQKEPF